MAISVPFSRIGSIAPLSLRLLVSAPRLRCTFFNDEQAFSCHFNIFLRRIVKAHPRLNTKAWKVVVPC